MSEKKYTQDDLQTQTQIARIEEKLDILMGQFNFSKKIFWGFVAPVITALSAVSSTITSKIFGNSH